MSCNICASNSLIEGMISGGRPVFFETKFPGPFKWLPVPFVSKVGVIACKDCGNIVQMRLLDLEGLKKLEKEIEDNK